MKAPDRVGFLKEAYDSGFRRTQEGENLGDDYSNMTNAVRKGCANDITAKVGDFVSIQTSEYKGEYR